MLKCFQIYFSDKKCVENYSIITNNKLLADVEGTYRLEIFDYLIRKRSKIDGKYFPREILLYIVCLT